MKKASSVLLWLLSLSFSLSYGAVPVAVTVSGGSGSGEYLPGTEVKLSAEDKPGYRFLRWEAAESITTHPYLPNTTLTVPDHPVQIRAVFLPPDKTGLDDIDHTREAVRMSATHQENVKSRRATLYRWWRYLWHQGIDLDPFDSLANQLVDRKDDTQPSTWQAIDEGFALLEEIFANPTYIPEQTAAFSSGPTTTTDWPVYHGTDGSQRGYSPDVGPQEGRLAWKYPKSYGWNAAPAIVQGKVYLAGAGSDVVAYCLDEASGKVLWKGRQYGDYYGDAGSRWTPAVVGEQVVIQTGRELRAFDASTGRARYHAPKGQSPDQTKAVRPMVYLLGTTRVVLADAALGKVQWTYELDDHTDGEPVLAGEQVLVGNHAGKLRALSVATGAEQWVYQAPAALRGTPGVGASTVYQGDNQRTLHAVDRRTGALRWQFTAPEKEDKAFQYLASATEANGKVYVGTAAGYLYCLDKADGTVVWKHRLNDWVRSRAWVSGDTVTVATMSGEVVALQDEGESVRELWIRPISEHGFTADVVGSSRGLIVSDQHMIAYSLSPQTGNLQWKHSMMDGLWLDGELVTSGERGGQQSSPTVVDGTVYIANTDGFVNAVDVATGEERWRFESKGNISPSPTVADGKVFFGQTYQGFGDYYALDKDTGEPVWNTKALGSVWISAAFAHGKLFVGNKEGYVFAVDPKDGHILWQYNTITDTDKARMPESARKGHGFPPGVYCNPAVDEQNVYIGSWSGYYFALDQETGQVRWRTSTNAGNPYGGLPDSSAPVLWKDHLYVQKQGAEIAALNKHTGSIDWTWRCPPGYLQNGTVAAANGTVVGSVVRKVIDLPYDATIFAFSDVPGGGRQRWEYSGGGGLTAPVVTDDKVVFGSSGDVFITCLNLADGSVVWRYRTGGMMLESVPALYGDKVIALVKNGYMYAIR